MPTSLSTEVQKFLTFKSFFPALDNLTFAEVTQRIISSLNGLKLVPKQVVVRGDKIGYPLKQNIITANQKNMNYHWNKTSFLPIKRISTNKQKLEETYERTKNPLSSPATTSRTVTKDSENYICTMSSLVNSGILNS